ncbi:MAG: hypothetical protein AAGG08_11105, partial [Actinomycetota bacterium]
MQGRFLAVVTVGACAACATSAPAVERSEPIPATSAPTTSAVMVEESTQSGDTGESEPPAESGPTTVSSTAPPNAEPGNASETTTSPPFPAAGADQIVEQVEASVGGTSVTISLLSVQAPDLPGGFEGFTRGLLLDDGSILASGFALTEDSVEGNAGWSSVDGVEWRRVADIADGSGTQSVLALYRHPDGVARSVVVEVETLRRADGTLAPDLGLAVEWQLGDNGWGARELVGNAFINQAHVTADQVILAGAVNPDSDFTPAVFEQDAEASTWTATPIDLDESGEPHLGGVAMDVLVDSDRMIAVGATTSSDPVGIAPTELFDALTSTGAIDAAVWTRPLTGGSWELLMSNAFSGVIGGAIALDIELVDDAWFLLVRETEAYRQVVQLYRSDDLGTSWQRIRIERAVTGNLFDGSEASNAGLYRLDD